MKSAKIIVKLNTGLHARPAQKFVQLAKTFFSDITISFGGKSADAKSILNLLTIGVFKDSEIMINADGPDEDNAIKTLSEFVQNEK
jgi:phosphocarrier protein HPr